MSDASFSIKKVSSNNIGMAGDVEGFIGFMVLLALGFPTKEFGNDAERVRE